MENVKNIILSYKNGKTNLNEACNNLKNCGSTKKKAKKFLLKLKRDNVFEFPNKQEIIFSNNNEDTYFYIEYDESKEINDEECEFEIIYEE